MISCGIPFVDTYVKYTRDAQFKKYTKRQCEDFDVQFSHRMQHSYSLCDCYKEFKDRLLLEPYLQKLKGKQRVQLSQFRCAIFTSTRVTERVTDNHIRNCLFCCKLCKTDAYHMIMIVLIY